MNQKIHKNKQEAHLACEEYMKEIYLLQARLGVWEESEDSCSPTWTYTKYLDENGKVCEYCFFKGDDIMTDFWKPIETCPKDGSNFLAIELGNSIPFVAYWSVNQNRVCVNLENYYCRGDAILDTNVLLGDVYVWSEIPKIPSYP